MTDLPKLPSTHFWDVRPVSGGTSLKLMKYGKIKDKTIARTYVVFADNLATVAQELIDRHL